LNENVQYIDLDTASFFTAQMEKIVEALNSASFSALKRDAVSPS